MSTIMYTPLEIFTFSFSDVPLQTIWHVSKSVFSLKYSSPRVLMFSRGHSLSYQNNNYLFYILCFCFVSNTRSLHCLYIFSSRTDPGDVFKIEQHRKSVFYMSHIEYPQVHNPIKDSTTSFSFLFQHPFYITYCIYIYIQYIIYRRYHLIYSQQG